MKNYFRLLLLLAVLSSVALARSLPYVPDYFPSGLGSEWHYDVKPEGSPTTKTKNVISKNTPLAGGGEDIEVTTTTPTESKSFYHKVAGWVILLKVDMPAASYVMDYEEDKKELMNPLAIGKGWNYKGTAGGMELTQEWKIVGTESVTVPAGKYSAVKVESKSNFGGNAIKYTYWYVDRIGSVKSISEAAGGTKTVVELTKVVFPKGKQK
jgi:hypothetical protein